MNFNSIKWQDSIVNNLKNSIKASTLNHAILFTGNTDSAVLLANATADAILCDEKNGNACGVCPSCVKTNAGSHPDKIIISATKKTIGVDEIRDVINNMYVRPFIAEKKIFIFTEAHKMTPQAQNALLKVLEAPPEYGIFLMAAEKEEQLLETVLSRLTKYKLALPSSEQVLQYLLLKYPEKKASADFAAKLCGGNLSLAERYINDDSQGDKRKRLLMFITKIISGSKSSVFDFAGYLNEYKDDFDENIEYIYILLRDMLFIKNALPKSSIINSDLYDMLFAYSSKLSEKNIFFFASKFSDCKDTQKVNSAFKLTLLNALMKVWEELHGRNSCC